jgi:peptidoglycan/LPS O-acetylase OafA/YrhL
MAHPSRVEPALAPPPGNPRFPLFDSLRAIAALSIFTAHALGINGGRHGVWYGRYANALTAGVAIFFVISGFLLYRPFVAAWMSDKHGPRIRDYARRRVLRIVPAYWFALTAVWLLFGLSQMSSSHWWSYYTFTQIYNNLWALGGIFPAWSLAVEASFYVALPLFALFFVHAVAAPDRRSKIQAQLWVLAVFFLCAPAVRDLFPNGTLVHSLFGFADWFAIGMALAVGSVAFAGQAKKPRVIELVEQYPGACWFLAFVAFVAAANIGTLGPGLFTRQRTGETIAIHVLGGVIGLFLCLPAIWGDARVGATRAFLGSRVLSWLGLISYGIFLWQLPLLQRVWKHYGKPTQHEHTVEIFVVGLAVTIAAAAFSYYVIERPFLRFKDVRLIRRRRAVPARARA